MLCKNHIFYSIWLSTSKLCHRKYSVCLSEHLRIYLQNVNDFVVHIYMLLGSFVALLLLPAWIAVWFWYSHCESGPTKSAHPCLASTVGTSIELSIFMPAIPETKTAISFFSWPFISMGKLTKLDVRLGHVSSRFSFKTSVKNHPSNLIVQEPVDAIGRVIESILLHHDRSGFSK